MLRARSARFSNRCRKDNADWPTLLQGQSTQLCTSPARTAFRLTYRRIILHPEVLVTLLMLRKLDRIAPKFGIHSSTRCGVRPIFGMKDRSAIACKRLLDRGTSYKHISTVFGVFPALQRAVARCWRWHLSCLQLLKCGCNSELTVRAMQMPMKPMVRNHGPFA